jgi:hypothetical protein
MNKLDYTQRVVGWLITIDHSVPHNTKHPDATREGWGQLVIHADETRASFDRVIGRTVFMDRSLTEHMIPDEQKVRWLSFDDDGNQYYEGIVRVDWIMNSSDDDDLAYNIDRFNETDVGAVHVFYSSKDIISCARKLDKPDWMVFAMRHKKSDIFDTGNPESGWIEIYG